MPKTSRQSMKVYVHISEAFSRLPHLLALLVKLNFGLVLWLFNNCWLFNAKSCFYIYIKYMICKDIL